MFSTTSAPRRFGCNCNSSPCSCTVVQPQPVRTLPDQRSLTDQLHDAITLCNKAGLYDAADLIRRLITPKPVGPISNDDAAFYPEQSGAGQAS